MSSHSNGVVSVRDESAQPAAGAQRSGDAALPESPGGHVRMPGQPMSDEGLVLSSLAGIDEAVLVRNAEWKGLAQHLDALRREIAVTSAQVQRSRSIAARKPSRDDHDGDGANSSGPSGEEERASQLMLEFESALRDAEERRVSFHAEMGELRRRRGALLQRLPAAVSLAYRSLAEAGRVPVIAEVIKGACGGCESSLPESAMEVLKHGAVVACARCERLLHPSRHAE